ncbi:MAG: cell division protein SepF [Candidatus Bathyarchaeia archaeon]|jgi:SepF-like predicted cell division protein (DUF552 family)
MKFSLFHKQKQQTNPEQPAVLPQEEPKEAEASPDIPKEEATAPPASEPAPVEIAPTQEIVAPEPEKKPEMAETQSKTYLKAMPLKAVSDVENVENEVKNGNIIILRVTPLASKNIEDVKNAVNELTQFAESIGGDIARLGEERVVICPKNIRIWREKTPAQNDSIRTAAPTAA